jgi:hypothetical protein
LGSAKFILKGKFAGSTPIHIADCASSSGLGDAFASALHRPLQGETMDPITLVGLFASLIEIAVFFRSVGRTPDTPGIIKEFRARQIQGGPEASIKIDDEDLRKEVDDFLDLEATSQAFLDRIRARCNPPYEAVRDDTTKSDADVADAQEARRRCICRNVDLARNENGGVFPSDKMKDYWERFGCRA